MTERAHAKLNLALVVGPLRPDGRHEVVSVLQAIDLHDDVELEPAGTLTVEGFPQDTLVRGALAALARRAGVRAAWRVRIEKRIPVAGGLGGGSSDAAAALRLANRLLPEPLPGEELHALAAELGADVPFFLRSGPQLATGSGTELAPLELPTEYAVALVLPAGARKPSTALVYREFDLRGGAAGFALRAERLRAALAGVVRAADLARLPPNDLASSPLAGELRRRGAFRADVTGAGPVVYGLFERAADAERALAGLPGAGRTWLARPVDGR
ncbi:MAG TPA: hypothetical protein VNJ46_08305 [Gaiellaceae bacterium]|nr:hypothetical protein [Gaiellaceae bacterium]